MRKLNGITIDGEFLGNSVVINGMFRAICTISPIVMRDFVYIINRVEQIDEAVKINTFNCPDTSSIDIEFSNSQTEGYATLFYTLQNSQPRLLDCNLVLGDEEVIGSLLDDEDFLDNYSPDTADTGYDDEYYDDDYYDEDDGDEYSGSGGGRRGSGTSAKRTESGAYEDDNYTDDNYNDSDSGGTGTSVSDRKSTSAASGMGKSSDGQSDSEEVDGSANDDGEQKNDRASRLERMREGRAGGRTSPAQERMDRMKKQRERREQLKERVKQRREEINETISEMQENALDRLKAKQEEKRAEAAGQMKKVPPSRGRQNDDDDDDFITGAVSGAKEINDYTIIAKTLKIEAQNMEGFGFPAAAGMNQYNPYGNNGFGGQQGGFGNPQDSFGNNQGFGNSFDGGQDFGNSGGDFGEFNNDFGSNSSSGFDQGFNNPQQMNGNMWQQPFGPNNGMSYPNMNVQNNGMPMPPRELYSVDENYNADDISDLYSDFYDIPPEMQNAELAQGNANQPQTPGMETSELDALKAELEALKAANQPPEGLMTLEEFKAQQKELEEERLKASRRKMKIVGSRGQVNASALDGGVFVSGSRVYKWGDTRKLEE